MDFLDDWEILQSPSPDPSLPLIYRNPDPNPSVFADYFSTESIANPNTPTFEEVGKVESSEAVPEENREAKGDGIEKVESLGVEESDGVEKVESLEVEESVGVEKVETLGVEKDERSDGVEKVESLAVEESGVVEKVGSFGVEKSDGGGKVDWRKFPMDIVKFCVLRFRPIWGVSIAAAVLGFVVLGQRWYRMRQRARAIRVRVAIDNKKVTESVARAARLNEAFSTVRIAPLIKTSFPSCSTEITPWAAMALR